MKIRAAVIREPGEDFQITELTLEPPKESEVLVKLAACGVCHTDDVARNQIIPVPLPAVFGHEGCGAVQLFIPQLPDFYRQGRFPFDRLIEFYPFEEINRAFADTKSGKAVKAVLRMPQ